MATRAKWIERIFGGLDKMYVIHRRSGVIAIILLLLHFTVIPKTPEFTIGKPMGFYTLILILIGVILSAAPIFKRKIKYNKWLNFHKTMGLFYTVGVMHALFVPTLISQLPIVRTYVFGMAFIGIACWIYRAFLYDLFVKKLDYTVESVKNFGDQVVEATLKPVSEKLIFKAGQFAFFRFDETGSKEAHPFTISSHPDDDNLRISVKALGDYTSNLQKNLKAGMKTKVEGPYGEFISNNNGTNQLWFAGGIGITPFLSLVRDLNGNKATELYWSVNNKSEDYYKDELEEAANENSNLKFEIWNADEKGFIGIEKINATNNFKDCDIFICGPEAMRNNLIKGLKGKGVNEKEIQYEFFSFR
jgi:predicted ferric reductase